MTKHEPGCQSLLRVDPDGGFGDCNCEAAETEAVRAFMLGSIAGLVSRPEFTVKVRNFIANYDDDGIIQSFTIVTESGRRYVLSITPDGMEEL